MALTQEDVDALGKLLDQRLEAHGKLIDQKLEERERRARNRRRFWIWFWILLFVGSSVFSWFGAQRLIKGFQDQLSAQEEDFSRAKLAYQEQLAKDRQLQQERAQAEKAVGYRSAQPQPEYEAQLVKQMLQIVGQAQALNAKAKASTDGDDLDSLMKQLDEAKSVFELGSSTMTQIMLRNTDPAHNTRAEHLAAGETGTQPANPDPVNEQLRQLQDQPPAQAAPAPAP